MTVYIILWIIAIIGAFYAYKKESKAYNSMSGEEKIAYEIRRKAIWESFRNFK